MIVKGTTKNVKVFHHEQFAIYGTRYAVVHIFEMLCLLQISIMYGMASVMNTVQYLLYNKLQLPTDNFWC